MMDALRFETVFRRCLPALAVAASAGVAAAQDFAPPTPTPEHQQMAHEVGVWDAKAKFWPAPGAPALESPGTETCEMFGPFWLVSRYEVSFGGMPFTGLGHTGFDTDTDEYVSTWIDDMAPALMVSRGKFDPATKTLTLTGETVDWMTGQPKQVKLTTAYPDADHKHFEMHEKAAGDAEWNKTLAIDYVRRK